MAVMETAEMWIVQKAIRAAMAVAVIMSLWPSPAAALERLCDPAFEDCRAPLLSLIKNENVAIDVAFWFMTDTQYSNAILARWQAGVPVRVLMDTEANAAHSGNAAILTQLKNAGIPMRQKTGTGILHWKLMIFQGQNTVEWSGANYSTVAFLPGTPYRDYEDEIIHFTDDPSLVGSFQTKYDDIWTTTSGYDNYANVTALVRRYPTHVKDPELNFPPTENYRTRSVNAYSAETQSIDVSMFRITDIAQSNAMIAAQKRGVPVRLITDPTEYRNPDRLWHSYNVDRMYAAGIAIKFINHAGVSHEKLVLLSSQAMAIFGSSNWSTPSAASQLEHNLFTTRGDLVSWLRAHWDRKWNNTAPYAETKAFVPLPPSAATLTSPANGATGIATSINLKWYAGKWAHKYDVYLGTNPSSLPRILTDSELGPSETTTDYKSLNVSGLSANTTYYWKVVSRTMANVTATSATGSFSTGGSASTTGTLPAGWSTRDIGSVGAAGSASASSGTFTVKGSGSDVWNSADEFRFVYKTLTGDGSITARVASVTNQNAWSKAGVMMRETLNAGSKHATMFASAGKGLAFQRRTSTNGTSNSTSGASSATPYWVRVTRSGNTFSAYQSANGSTWTLVGSATMNMTATIYVGLAVTSHADGALATGTFTNVQ
jgi:phosphatidylserine/phosphatidylglycerophosphate/cardiolipin synthase-like enzyme/regulation of enolase protein 1 (concanavalin A-like superfamily)